MNTPQSDGASYINEAIRQLFQLKSNDEISALPSNQAALKTALNEVVVTDHTRGILKDLNQRGTNHIEFLTIRRTLDANALNGYILSDMRIAHAATNNLSPSTSKIHS